jgi:hypothetical protein
VTLQREKPQSKIEHSGKEAETMAKCEIKSEVRIPSSSQATCLNLRPPESPKGNFGLDVWETALWDDIKNGHCRACLKIGEVDPNRKEYGDHNFRHRYKRYKKNTS